MNDKRIPLTEAAKLLHSTPLNVLMHIKRGLLVGFETDNGWEVSSDSLEDLTVKTEGGQVNGVCASNCAKKHACGRGCG